MYKHDRSTLLGRFNWLGGLNGHVLAKSSETIDKIFVFFEANIIKV